MNAMSLRPRRERVSAPRESCDGCEMSEDARTEIVGLDKWELSPHELARLKGEARVTAMASYPDVEALLPLDPSSRREVVEGGIQALLDSLRERFPEAGFEITRAGALFGFAGAVASSDVEWLARMPGLEMILVEDVTGRRVPHRREEAQRWFSVKALLVEEVEGASDGLQRVEDRVTLVRAVSEEDATRKLETTWEEEAQTLVLDDDYRLVRWRCESVVDVQAVLDQGLEPDGAQVHWEYRRRRRTGPPWDPRAGQASSKLRVAPRLGSDKA